MKGSRRRRVPLVRGPFVPVKRLGIPDSHIILMLADDMACNARNVKAGQVYGNENRELDLYGDNIEVDYRGYEVTPESLLRVLTNRHPPGTSRSKRLLTDAGSNILLFMTGHGGDEFLKFQDQFEIMSKDVADALGQMSEKRRYNEVLYIAETCQAATMAAQFYSPGVLAVGSSAKDESSYSHHQDMEIGLAVIDRFTYYTLEFMEHVDVHSATTADKLFETLVYTKLASTSEPILDNFKRPLETVRLTEFFGSVMKTRPMRAGYSGLNGGSRGEGEDGIGEDSGESSEWSRYRESEEKYRPLGSVIAPAEGGWTRERGGVGGSMSDGGEGMMTLVRLSCAALMPVVILVSISMY